MTDTLAGREQSPHDPQHHAAQLRGLEQLLGAESRRVLDLGCGCGRVLVPLARLGHTLVGIDSDPAVLQVCADALSEAQCTAELHVADFMTAWPMPVEAFDAVVCLGNTFTLLADVDTAVDLLDRARAQLRPGGMFITDDCPGDLWPELAEGNWSAGLSPDGLTQMVWDARDAVFAIREGAAVDPDDWCLSPRDRRCRLWTDGALRLAARAAGLSAPEPATDHFLLVMRRGTTNEA